MTSSINENCPNEKCECLLRQQQQPPCTIYIALSDLNGNMSETSQRRVVIGRV